MKMINFVGTGCGAVDLITLRGKRLIEEADIIIYAGSLINKELLNKLSYGYSPTFPILKTKIRNTSKRTYF